MCFVLSFLEDSHDDTLLRSSMWCSKIICLKIQSQKWWKRMNRTKRPEPARVFWGDLGCFWWCLLAPLVLALCAFYSMKQDNLKTCEHMNLPYRQLHEQLNEALYCSWISGFHICSFKAMRIYGLSEMDKVGLWNFYQLRIMVTTGFWWLFLAGHGFHEVLQLL